MPIIGALRLHLIGGFSATVPFSLALGGRDLVFNASILVLR